jgi:predicted O-methyltransferase YrrM
LLDHLSKVIRQRVDGIPRTMSEVNYSLQMLAKMREQGWHDSISKREPIDENGNAVPWYTYSALEWLVPRVNQTDSVFEFGAGNSTIWYSQHAKNVVTVEHAAEWADKVKSIVGTNVTVLLRTAVEDQETIDETSPYSSTLEEYSAESFDIIVIDGMERVRCAQIAPTRLRENGIIIFDNSDRPEFKPGIDNLHQQGFGRIDFYGGIAQLGIRSCTSVFSKFNSRWTNVNAPLVFQGW